MIAKILNWICVVVFKMLGIKVKVNEVKPGDRAEVGREYTLNFDSGDPFKAHKATAKVKDRKDGWVKYAIWPYETGLFQNETMKEEKFLQLYTIKEV